MSVLLVEDHTPLTRALRRGLEEEGYAVDVASDCGEADDKARAADYEAIILDLTRLRDMGASLLGRWRRAGLTAPVLVLTAPGSVWGGAAVGPLGADGCLTVPFRLEELFARLKEMARPFYSPLGGTPADS